MLIVSLCYFMADLFVCLLGGWVGGWFCVMLVLSNFDGVALGC